MLRLSAISPPTPKRPTLPAKADVAATFLLDVASRISADETIDLRMSRHDIADDLGLTDGLANTQLEGTAVIALPTSRRILLRNRAALHRLNS